MRERIIGTTIKGRILRGVASVALVAGGIYGVSKIVEARQGSESATPTPVTKPAGDFVHAPIVPIDRLIDQLADRLAARIQKPVTSTVTATVTAKTAEGTPVPAATPNTEQKSNVRTKVEVPSSHGAVPVAKLDASTPRGTWIRPIYDEYQADKEHDWRGIGPWVPVFFDSDPGAAHLKTYGNVGEVVIVGDKGGKVRFGVWQEAQHDQEATRRGDGKFDPNWKLQYTFKGLVPGTEVIPFDPDTGAQLIWDDGVTPVVYAANYLGTFSVELPRGEVRVMFAFVMPGQVPGVQNPEVIITRGPNDQPGLTGENKLPKSVSKPVIPD